MPAKDLVIFDLVLLGGIRQVDFGEVFQYYNLIAHWSDVQGTKISIPLSPQWPFSKPGRTRHELVPAADSVDSSWLPAAIDSLMPLEAGKIW
ncbi:hypothetical protein HanPI659440_Chr09g0335831 [Helianthus annuus]|nr:hypothetical protein HanPI659440_Chr09g0335831 [Helianthus annuus]